MLRVFVSTPPAIFNLILGKIMNETRNKVTKQHLLEQIADVSYFVLPGTTVTICSIAMRNGFSVRGESACVDPNNFNEQTGREIAYENAFNKLWELEGYLLANERYLKRRGDANQYAQEQDVARHALLTKIQKLLRVDAFELILPRLQMTYDNGGKDMTFGAALAEMRNGCRVARTGWNGKGMFVYLVPPASYPVQTGAAKSFFGENSLVPYNAYFAIKNVDNTVSTWVPSVNDCLADDWAIV